MFFSYFMHRENSATENRLSDRANFRICCSPNRPLLTLKISAIYLFYFFYYYNWRKSSHKIGAKIVRKWIFCKLCWIWLKFCTHVGLAVRLTDPVEFCEKSEIQMKIHIFSLIMAYFGTFATLVFTHFYRQTPKTFFASSKLSNEESSPRNKPHDTLTALPCHITPKKGLKSGILQFCPERDLNCMG